MRIALTEVQGKTDPYGVSRIRVEQSDLLAVIAEHGTGYVYDQQSLSDYLGYPRTSVQKALKMLRTKLKGTGW
jgi:hypothetical protein